MKQQNRVSQFAKNCLKVTALLVWGAVGMVWADEGSVPAPAPPDGTRIFEGDILEGTCEVDMARSDRIVNLPPVSKNLLRNYGETAGDTKFSIILRGCRASDYNIVRLSWSGLDGDSLLLNRAYYFGKGAANIYIQVVKLNGQGLTKTGKVSIDREKAENSGVGNIQPKFDYIAKYFAGGQVTTGNVESEATFEITYE